MLPLLHLSHGYHYCWHCFPGPKPFQEAEEALQVPKLDMFQLVLMFSRVLRGLWGEKRIFVPLSLYVRVMSCLVSCLKPAFFGTVFFFPFCNLFDSKECLKVLDKRDKEALGYVEIWMVSIDKLTVDSQVLCFQFRRKITMQDKISCNAGRKELLDLQEATFVKSTRIVRCC